MSVFLTRPTDGLEDVKKACKFRALLVEAGVVVGV